MNILQVNKMSNIRNAKAEDLSRIAEIEIFNYRLNFYPIFRDDFFYFRELQVPKQMENYRNVLGSIWVCDDGAVKGFIYVENGEIRKLFVEPVLQRQGIGAKLLEFAVSNLNAHSLWALEKNTRGIAFYERHGFFCTGEKKHEEGTAEYLVRMEWKS